MFWEYMLRGLCHGGYVLGLLGALTLAACLLALFCIVMGIVFGSETEDRELEGRNHRVRKNQQL